MPHSDTHRLQQLQDACDELVDGISDQLDDHQLLHQLQTHQTLRTGDLAELIVDEHLAASRTERHTQLQAATDQWMRHQGIRRLRRHLHTAAVAAGLLHADRTPNVGRIQRLLADHLLSHVNLQAAVDDLTAAAADDIAATDGDDEAVVAQQLDELVRHHLTTTIADVVTHGLLQQSDGSATQTARPADHNQRG